MAVEKRDTWKERKELEKLIKNAVLHDLDDAGKPVLWREKKGSTISVQTLKAVLNCMVTFYPNIFPRQAEIAAITGVHERTVKRAIQVLQTKEILVVHATRNALGQTNNRYVILDTKLRFHGQDSRLPLFHQPGGIPSKPGGISAPLRFNEEEFNTTSKRGVGADLFSSEEEGQRAFARATRQRAVLGRAVGDQARIMIYIGIWVERGFLSENDFEECLRTVEENNPRSRFGYYKTSISNRLIDNGHTFEGLMNSTSSNLVMR